MIYEYMNTTHELVIFAVTTNTSLLLPTLTPASEDAHPTCQGHLHLSFSKHRPSLRLH